MTAGEPRWRHVLNGAVLVGILIVAGVVVHTTPSEEVWQSAIPVRGAIGQTLTGRNIEATVDTVRVADAVTASNGWAGPTTGVWVVVDASVAAVVTDYGVSLGTAQLQIGDTTYSASERPGDATIAQTPLSVGLPKSGPLMFEVARAALEGAGARTAELQFAANADTRTDSMVVVPVDLTAITVEAAVTTSKPVWGVR